jgi:hypothetical protein
VRLTAVHSVRKISVFLTESVCSTSTKNQLLAGVEGQAQRWGFSNAAEVRCGLSRSIPLSVPRFRGWKHLKRGGAQSELPVAFFLPRCSAASTTKFQIFVLPFSAVTGTKHSESSRISFWAQRWQVWGFSTRRPASRHRPPRVLSETGSMRVTAARRLPEVTQSLEARALRGTARGGGSAICMRGDCTQRPRPQPEFRNRKRSPARNSAKPDRPGPRGSCMEL